MGLSEECISKRIGIWDEMLRCKICEKMLHRAEERGFHVQMLEVGAKWIMRGACPCHWLQKAYMHRRQAEAVKKKATQTLWQILSLITNKNHIHHLQITGWALKSRPK